MRRYCCYCYYCLMKRREMRSWNWSWNLSSCWMKMNLEMNYCYWKISCSMRMRN